MKTIPIFLFLMLFLSLLSQCTPVHSDAGDSVNQYYEEGREYSTTRGVEDPVDQPVNPLPPSDQMRYQAGSQASEQVPSIIILAKECEVDEIKEALERGTNVNYRDNKGRTPLMMAAASGCLEGVEILIEHVADPTLLNAEDFYYVDPEDGTRILFEKGKTAYDMAIQRGFEEIALFLYENE
jgi:ankyrin repeat protein